MNIDLAVFDFCPYCQRVRIVAEMSGVPHTLHPLPDGAERPEWFKKGSPMGRAPLVVVDGVAILESNVIAELFNDLGEVGLLPADPVKRARVRAWCEFAGSCQMGMGGLVRASDEEAYQKALAELQRNLVVVAAELDANGPLFMGETLTLVDTTFAPLFAQMDLLESAGIAIYPADQPRLRQWAAALAALPAVSRAVDGDQAGAMRSLISRLGPQGVLAKRYVF